MDSLAEWLITYHQRHFEASLVSNLNSSSHRINSERRFENGRVKSTTVHRRYDRFLARHFDFGQSCREFSSFPSWPSCSAPKYTAWRDRNEVSQCRKLNSLLLSSLLGLPNWFTRIFWGGDSTTTAISPYRKLWRNYVFEFIAGILTGLFLFTMDTAWFRDKSLRGKVAKRVVILADHRIHSADVVQHEDGWDTPTTLHWLPPLILAAFTIQLIAYFLLRSNSKFASAIGRSK